jgi:glycosyltransferase involved in cell wall biosynthesis
MNKQLAISIPTYNRTEILKSNLVSIINQAKRFNIPIYISDDSDNNRTHEMIKSYIKDYQFLFYTHNSPSLRHDKNIISCLSSIETNYIWLIGDSISLSENALFQVLSIIESESPTIISCNSKDRIVNIESKHITDKDYVLENFGWHNTLTGTTIYSNRSLNNLMNMDLLECKNFPQIAIIFNALNRGCSFYWEKEPLIYAHKDKKSYWAENIFETFIDDFSRTIFYLPSDYSNKLKAKVIPMHSLKAKIFDLKSLLILRTENIYDFNKFKKYYKTFKKNSSTHLFLIFIISVLPRVILKPIRAILRMALN